MRTASSGPANAGRTIQIEMSRFAFTPATLHPGSGERDRATDG
ncbi:MAG: hypothetical protein ACRDM0_17540 [Thermoleophilaceae bacterium]